MFGALNLDYGHGDIRHVVQWDDVVVTILRRSHDSRTIDRLAKLRSDSTLIVITVNVLLSYETKKRTRRHQVQDLQHIHSNTPNTCIRVE